MRARWVVVVSLITLVSVVLAACGGGAAPTPTTGAAAPAGEATEPAVEATEPAVEATEPAMEATEPAAEATEPAAAGETPAAGGAETQLQLLGWASSEAEDTRLNQVIQTFNEQNPNFNATFNPVPEYEAALQTALAGTPPDLFYVNADTFPNLASQNALAAVGDTVEDLGDFYEPMLQAFTWEGELYAVPKDFSVLALVYNTTMLEAAGVTAPPANWDELRSTLQTLKDAGQPTACIDTTIDRWGVFALQAGGNFLSEDRQTAQFTSEPMVQGLTFYSDLVAAGLALPPGQLDSSWCGEAIGKERASITIEGNWVVPFLRDSFPDLQWDAAPLPEGPAGKGTWAFTAAYGYSPRSPNPEGSKALLSYLTGKEGMWEWTSLGLAMPTRQSLADQWAAEFPDLEAFIQSADFATVRPSAVGFPDVIRELQSQVEQVVAGTTTPEAALEQVQAIAEQTLQSNQ